MHRSLRLVRSSRLCSLGLAALLAGAGCAGEIEGAPTATDAAPQSGELSSNEEGLTLAADTYLSSGSPSANYGTKTVLIVKKSASSGSLYRSLFKVTVPGTAPVSAARLELTVQSGSVDGGKVYLTASSWSEGTVTHASAPALIRSTAVASFGAVRTGAVVSVDLSSVVTGPGTYSFLVDNQNDDGAYYYSKESSTPPRFIVTRASTEPAASCGDGACGSAESCSTCPSDCGVCTGGQGPGLDLGAEPGPVPVVATTTQYSYTPSGCAYVVRTQTVTEAGPHVDKNAGGARFVDHVHTSYPGAASRGFAVNWRSDVGSREALLIVGTDPVAVQNQTTAKSTATTTWRWGHSMLMAGARLHEVHICDLSPDLTYYYKVGGGGLWSKVYKVSTAPAVGTPAPVKFAVFGDSRDLKGSVLPTIVREARAFGADFAVFTGDAVSTGSTQSQWDAFFAAQVGGASVEDGLAELPLMPANGNHEALSVNYLTQFALPGDKAAGEVDGEQWYSFDYGPVHMVVLDDSQGDVTGAEKTWLAADLASVDRKKTPWVFVAHHRPPYTCGSSHSANTTVRDAWQPLYDRYGVDIVFNGHNHEYERSVPIRGINTAAPRGANGVPLPGVGGIASGTIYVLTGGAGAGLYSAGTCSLSQTSMSQFNYVEVSVSGMTLSARVVNAVTLGAIDSFSYTKSSP